MTVQREKISNCKRCNSGRLRRNFDGWYCSICGDAYPFKNFERNLKEKYHRCEWCRSFTHPPERISIAVTIGDCVVRSFVCSDTCFTNYIGNYSASKNFSMVIG